MKSHMGLVGALCFMVVVTAVVDAITGNTECCSCSTMMPNYIPRGALPQSLPSPFKIVIEEQSYDVNKPVHVTLISTNMDKFRSFMLVAYTHVPGQKSLTNREPRGQLEIEDDNYQTMKDCSIRENKINAFALISQERKPVDKLKFKWTPFDTYGHIEFRATFVMNDTEYWVKEKSAILYDSTERMPPKKYEFTSPINTQQCGKTKGCYRVPEGCAEPQCLYILTWTSDTQSATLELGGLTNGASDSYVAAALSDDTYVGDDTVFVCAHNLDFDSTEVYFGKHNDNYETDVVPKYEITRNDKGKQKRTAQLYKKFIVKEEGSYQNNRLLCRFTINKDLKLLHKMLRSIRGWKAHLILSHGLADNGKPYPMGVGHNEYPHASEDKVLFTEYTDFSEKASYPLVKAHGCLMILAWILFSSVGFLLAKYYQPMWPEKRVYERKYWFMGHFKCMTMVFIIVLISVILIFIEADGYTKTRGLPYKAHPILGIIIFVCVLILPFIALMRPGPGHNCRNVFNWLYWIFATIANVLAIPNIFIGMDFGKSSVPWWATWILVFWVVFHIIVEVTLEIHQCMTHKKNKERRKKHELLKRDYPKQHHTVPEPAGRRFKRFMLLLHLAVTILITLIMIIIIAVS